MSPFDEPYWNLAQAAAWVEFRERDLVDHFKTADRYAYMAIGMYPSMWPKDRKRCGHVEELRRALEQDRLEASGFRCEDSSRLEDIPPAEWADFVIRPPLVCYAGQPQNQPWGRVRVSSADIKRLWRSVHEVSGRSRYDWDVIKNLYYEIQSQNPEMSQNELIVEIQGTFEERLTKKGPGRATLQRKIKTWP